MPKIHMQLRSNIRGKTKIGYLVRADRSGRFVYAKAGEVPIGVIAQSVAFGELCNIVTTGETLVYVHTPVSADSPVRAALTTEGVPAGSAMPVGSANSYTSVGQALETGKGLIRVSVNLGATLSSSGGGGDIPAGGTTGQALIKASSADYDVTWGTAGISDAPSDGNTYGRYNGTWSELFWQVYMGGVDVPDNEIYNGAFVNFEGDTTYIQVQWNQTTQTVELSYVGPTNFYEGWDIWVDDVDTTRVVTSGMAVNFKGSTYIDVTHNFVTGPPPHNDLTISIDQTALDGRYYTQTALDTILADYALQSWVSSNFDNYQSWGIVDGVYTRDVISADTIEFLGDTTYIQVQYTGYASGVHTMQFSYVGPTDFYAGWDPGADTGSPTRVGSAHEVNFLGSTYIDTSYNFTSGSPPTHDITISIDTTALDGRYYTQSAITTILADYALQSWVTSNFDNYQSWNLQTGGITREAITSGFDLDFIGDTTYIQVQYNATEDRLEFSYVGPTDFYAGWDPGADTGSPTRVGSAHEVNFLGGTYINTTYLFTAGSPPTHDITIDIDTTALDGRYYTQSALNTILADYALQSWVTSNFDNYGSWDLQTGGVHREYITSGFALDFIGDATYIQVQYNATEDRLEFSYVGPTTFYSGWVIGADSGDTPTTVGSGHDVTFIGGTYINTVYAVSTLYHDITIDIDTTALDGRYYTQSALTTILADYALQSWVTSNFDDYSNWNIVDGVFDRAVLSGDQVEFVAGTGMTVQYSDVAGVHTITISYSGSSGYTGWFLNSDGDTPQNIGSGAEVMFVGGTNVTTSHSYNSGEGRWELTINATDQYTGTVTSVQLSEGALIDLTGTNPITTSGTITIAVDLSELATSVSDGDGDFFVVVDSTNAQHKLTKANINLSGFNNDSNFATQSWVSSNFDDYGGWDVYTGGVFRETIVSGERVDFVGGTDIQVTYNATGNVITVAYTGTPGTMSNWYWEIEGVPHTISNGGTAELIAGTNITISYSLGGSGEHQATINSTDQYTGTVTSIGITAGALIDVTGSPVTTSGNITVAVDLSELATSTSDADGDYFVVVDAANAQYKLTKANINLSGFNNDSNFATQSWVSTNYDDYDHWKVHTGGVFRENIASGDFVNFVGGTDMQVLYDAPSNTLTFNYTGSPGSMDSWYWEIEGTPHTISNGGTAELIAGTNITISYSLGGSGEHQATINSTDQYTGTVTSIGITAGALIDVSGSPITTSGNITVAVDLSELTTSTSDADGDFFAVIDSTNVQRKLTKANINLSGFNNDSNFATQSWVTSNFDDYGGWDVYTGGVFRETIASGDRLDFVSGTDITVTYGATGNTVTIAYTGSAGYTGWYVNSDDDTPNSIGNGAEVMFVGGTNVTTTHSWNSTELRWEVEITAAGSSSQWTTDTYGITYSGGNVGIGVASSSSYRLAVSGDVYISDTGTAVLDIYGDTAAASQASIIKLGATSTARARGILYVVDGSTVEWWSGIGYNVGNDWVLGYDASAGQSEYSTAAIIRANSSGNVGIGGVDPGTTARLVVDGGTSDMIGVDRITGKASIKAVGDTYLMIDSSGGYVSLNHYVSDNVQLAYGGGDVAIGPLTTPYAVASGTKLMVYSGTSGYASNLQLVGNSTSTAVGRVTFHNLASAAGDSYLRIAQIDGGRDTDNDAGYLRFYAFNASGTAYYLLNLSGYSGVATLYYGSSSARLATSSAGVTVTGAVSATGEVTAYSSDMRLKKNISIIKNPLDILDEIEGVSFDWIDGVEKLGFHPSHNREMGFIAQRLQSVVPEAVAYAPFDRDHKGDSISGEDYLTVKPEKLIPILVEAIKELRAEVKALKK